MKPIAIFQHTEVGAPGSILRILEKLGRPYLLIRIVEGEPVPSDASEFGGLIFMGGYMGVHDDFPWIRQEQGLIQQADRLNIPVAGHCLGSQLLASAFGAFIRQNEHPEIGWQHIKIEGGAIAEEWWGHPSGTSLLTFQWHGQTFDMPSEGIRIATSSHCLNQAFVLRGIHLAVQSHLEMTPYLVELSLERNGAQLEREIQKGNPAVTSIVETRRNLNIRTEEMYGILFRLYTRWVRNCV